MNEFNLKCKKAFKNLGIPKNLEIGATHGKYVKNVWYTEYVIYTQEQLQEMIMEKRKWSFFELLSYFFSYIMLRFSKVLNCGSHLGKEESFSEVWLNYTMKELHNKEWSYEQEDWV